MLSKPNFLHNEEKNVKCSASLRNYQLTFWKVSGGSGLNILWEFLSFVSFSVSFYSPYIKGHSSSSRIGRPQCQWVLLWLGLLGKWVYNPAWYPKWYLKCPVSNHQANGISTPTQGPATSLLAENYLDQTHILLIWAIKKKKLFLCVLGKTHIHTGRKQNTSSSTLSNSVGARSDH